MSIKRYYEKSVDDFPDDIIVRVRKSNEKNSDLWYAVLNTPPGMFGRSMPDFSNAADSKEKAITKTAKIIRDDANGIGKYAPHACFKGYDLHYILCPWWAHCMGETVDEEVMRMITK